MRGGRSAIDGLHHPGDGPAHRLDAEAKILATVAFVIAVIATPREAMWAFGIHAALVLGAAAAARIPARLLASRVRIEIPFLAFAVFLPIVGGDPRTDVLGVSLSEPGLWAAWNVVVKGTLGVLAAIVLAATTPVNELLAGLERLRVPRVLVSIAGFMARYLEVIAGEAARMRIARLSRAHDPRWLWQGRAFAASAGTLFVRSYERGERVYLAMCSRGYTGAMPALHHHRDASAWWLAAIVPAAATAVMVIARVAVL